MPLAAACRSCCRLCSAAAAPITYYHVLQRWLDYGLTLCGTPDVMSPMRPTIKFNAYAVAVLFHHGQCRAMHVSVHGRLGYVRAPPSIPNASAPPSGGAANTDPCQQQLELERSLLKNATQVPKRRSHQNTQKTKVGKRSGRAQHILEPSVDSPMPLAA